MTLIAPSVPQLRAQIQAIRDRIPKARVIGLRASVTWSGPDRIRVGDREVPIVTCPSILAVRAAIQEHKDTPGPIVILTDRPEAELGLDVLARLVKGRLLDFDPWGLLLDMFRAKEWDRQLRGETWLAETLIEVAPEDGYPPVPTGVLDPDTVWRHVLVRRYGFQDQAPDLRALLVWCQDSVLAARYAAEPQEARKAVAERIASTAGPAASAVLAAVVGGHTADSVPLGLAYRVLAHPQRSRAPKLRDAFHRLDGLLGSSGAGGVEPAQATAWAEAAEACVRAELERGRTHASTWFERADALLDRVGAAEFAGLSAWLPSGLDRRLDAWGKSLGQALAASPVVVTSELEDAAQAVSDHELAQRGEASTEAVTNALRLTRWLAQCDGSDAVPACSLADAARAYAAVGGYVDLARARVWDQGHGSKLRKAYTALIKRVEALRKQEDERFGALLANWAQLPPNPTDPLPIEEVLAKVVAPLAKATPVLLVVLDGMSQAVFRAVEDDLSRRGWLGIGPDEQAEPLGPVLAAFPTVTEICRTSLLTGALRRGTSPDEKKGFLSHQGLRAVSRAKKPPKLFHKAELVPSGGSGLTEEVHAALADPQLRVVGVVVNAVDDHLLKGDQVPVAWAVEQIRPFDALLTAARDAGRALVLTSDHGHVLERGTKYHQADNAGERWRPDDGQEHPGEILLRGPRLVSAAGDAIRAPWSERVRYSASKRHGYHGGASPAEVVVPLGVFSGTSAIVEGWQETTSVRPTWWVRAGEIVSAPAARGPLPPAGPLFVSAPTPAPEPRPEGDDWIDSLFASPLYKEQLARASRGAPAEARIRAVLAALTTRGGKQTYDGLLNALGITSVRLRGTLTGLRRVLNVDGYSVLSVDEESHSVSLDRGLLETQFELE